jgi:hypothetical protein
MKLSGWKVFEVNGPDSMALIYLWGRLIFVYNVFNVILYVNFLMLQFYKSI